MTRSTLQQIRTAATVLTNATIIAAERKRFKKEIKTLKTENEWLETQNSALKIEVGKMIGKAMQKHWDSVKALEFQLDGFEFDGKTYLTTISPALARIDFLRLPWRTNFALLMRWGFMNLIPQSAFGPLIARATVGPTPVKRGIGNVKSPGIDKTSIDSMLEAAAAAKEYANKVVKDAVDNKIGEEIRKNARPEARSAAEEVPPKKRAPRKRVATAK